MNCIQQSPSEANSRSATPQIRNNSWNPKGYYTVRKSPQLDPVVCQMKPLYRPTKSYKHIILSFPSLFPDYSRYCHI
jgi:hypothetical protein